MAISTKKKNQIIADHKAGRFDTQQQLLKHYQVDRKTLVKILEGISSTNTDIVEAGIAYENAKKSLKNPVEEKAVEKAVDEKIKHMDFFKNATLKNASVMMKKVDDKMAIHEHKAVQETLDKGMISMGLAERHAPRANITQNQAQQQDTEVTNNLKVTFE